MKYIFLCILWFFWCFLHSFFTSTKITAWFKNRLADKFRFYRISYNLFSLITVLPLLSWQGAIAGPVVIILSPFLMIFKYAALILSSIVIAGSFLSFDVKEFLGIGQVISRTRETQSHAVISKSGFYGIVRHPMYLGSFIFFTSLMMNAPLAQFAGYGILAVYMIIGTVREDRRLARELGEVYRNYQKEVPILFPKIFVPSNVNK